LRSTGVARAFTIAPMGIRGTARAGLPIARETTGSSIGDGPPRRSIEGIMEPDAKADGLALCRGLPTWNRGASSPLAFAASHGATTRPTVREMLARYTDKT
jgi:hypothetical protein